jgi:hypothetical protein
MTSAASTRHAGPAQWPSSANFVAMANIHPLAQALEDKVVNPVHRQFRL